VADYLSRKRGFVLVSHDRTLLDKACDHILNIGRHGFELHRGSFSSFWEQYRLRVKAEEEQAKRLGEEIERRSREAARTAGWAQRTESSKYNQGPVDRGYIGHKAAKLARRSKAAVLRKQDAYEQMKSMARSAERSWPMKMTPLAISGQNILRAENLTLSYTSEAMLEGLSLHLTPGAKLAIRGPNGCGKSLLMSVLAGSKDELLSGSIQRPAGLVISYVPQSAPRPEGRIMDLCRQKSLEASDVLTRLHYLGFGERDLSAQLKDLSHGQWRKVLLSLSLAASAHLYLWDEPLGYLDIFSRAQIEDMIIECRPTLVVIEHDQTFLGKIEAQYLDLTKWKVKRA
jgi:lincosamide and streptogramin A transport system ATP-binding/permease protein